MLGDETNNELFDLASFDAKKTALLVIDELGDPTGTPLEQTLLPAIENTARIAAAARRAGVIDGVAVLRRTFRVDAQPYAFPRRFGRGTEFCKLCRGVEHNVVGIAQQLIHLVCTVGGAEHVHLPAGHFLRAQPRLKQAAGLGARQMLCQQRVKIIVAERLLRQQHLAAGARRQCAKDFGILRQRALVYQVTGGRQGGKLRPGIPAECRKRRPRIALRHQSTSTGLWFSLRGRPYLSSASRNGSGLNSSTV